MKKLISIFITISILSFSVPSLAEDLYISLEPLPYSAHLLGETITIYGSTNISNVSVALISPDGDLKDVFVLSASRLKHGYSIPTDTAANGWAEGEWTIRAQAMGIVAELKINMTSAPDYDRTVRVAHYVDSTLQSLTSYQCRAIEIKDNIISFTLPDENIVKIYSWNNFQPVQSGESRVFITLNSADGYVTDVRTYQGTLSALSNHFTLKISENEYLKFFYWKDILTPVQ